MQRLSKPPLNLVTLRVEFPHNLKVSEKRSEYYEKVKTEFPLIVFPENKNLAFDFSDCHFRNNEGNAQVRIATNYFILETVKYENVDVFWAQFKKIFFDFSQCFQTTKITSVRLNYDNIIKMDKGLLGESFSDYFSLGIAFKDQQQRKFLTIDGSFLFSMDNGIIQMEIRPRQNQTTLAWDMLEFKIGCQVNKELTVDENLDTLKKEFDSAHFNIEELFISSLAEKYFQSLK